uniref:RNase H type-1 domain-containing protein n=3 Tax=Cajanus cajan TaxID=3821 RepID=A0A151UBZ7_CAJCA|nr:hypothetical protein KK1_021061 [Cajanus cajan]
MLGFSCRIGVCSILHAELWDIFYGLKILRGRGLCDNIISESDSISAVQFLNKAF